jgi:hypothetical protein
MRIKNKTLLYLILATVYSIVPTLGFILLNGKTMPGYTITNTDVLLIFCFTCVPFIIGFLGGEMYVDDMDASDPIYNPETIRKNKGH